MCGVSSSPDSPAFAELTRGSPRQNKSCVEPDSWAEKAWPAARDSKSHVPQRTEKMQCSGSEAAALLVVSSAATDADIESALEAVLRDGSVDAFAKAFGPRRLMKRLATGSLSERATDLADELLTAAADGPVNGLTAAHNFGEVLYQDELHPDDLLSLSSPLPPPLPASQLASWPLHLPLADAGSRAVYVPSSDGQIRFDATGGTEEETVEEVSAPVLKLAQLSRRARLGSEIETKIWPAAAILGRWLWRHRRLVRGQTILELGAGVGTAGLAAALCGARRVVMTDINEPALRCARTNCARNGDDVRAAACVSHLDWARPPLLEQHEAALEEANVANAIEPSESEVTAMLTRPFDIILAADVINDTGLSEMVYRMVQLYLAPKGLFVMVCPKARHRHCIERLRAMLVDSAELDVQVCDAPEWTRQGLEEAQVIEHELIIAQWINGRRGAVQQRHGDDGALLIEPALALDAPAKL